MLGESMRRRHKIDRKRDRSPDGAPRMRWVRWILTTLGLVPLAFGIGYIVAVKLLFPVPAAAEGNAVEVPALSGEPVPTAERLLDEVGLSVGEVDEIAHPDKAAGTVIGQSPLPGQQLRPGATVRIAVSSGPVTTAVPDIVGLTYEAAHLLLRDLGFDVNRRTETTTGTPGVVLRVHPEPGSHHTLPSAVTLTVGIEPEPEPEPEPLDSLRFDLFRSFDTDTLSPM